MIKFLVNKNGFSQWYEVEAITAQDAIEQQFNVVVYPYEYKGEIAIFDDIREDVDQLYAGKMLQIME